MALLRKLRSLVAPCVALDLRALALFRIGLGLLALADIVIRSEDLVAFHTDQGVMPRFFLLNKFVGKNAFSFLFVSGEPWFAALYFAVEVAFAIFLIFGWRSKLSLFVIWMMTIGLSDRMPAILHGGDILLRMIMFWGMFLPIGAKWSLDAYLSNFKARDVEPTYQISSLGTFAYLIQISCLYVFTSVLKSGEDWQNGQAVYYALHFEHLTTSFGMWLRQFPKFMEFATHVTLKVELLTPILFFIPWRNGLMRLVAFITLAGMHVSFWLSLRISLFAWTDVVSLLPLLPMFFFDNVIGRIKDNVRFQLPNFAKFEPIIASVVTTSIAKLSQFPAETPRLKMRLPTKAIAVYGVVFILIWNVNTIPSKKRELPSTWTRLGLALRLDQHWNMFAPRPSRDSGWFVMPGRLDNGHPIDVWQQKLGEPSFEKPKLISATYSNFRWSKFMVNIWSNQNEEYRLNFGKYLCRRYNKNVKDPTQRIKTFEIHYMLQNTLPNFQEPKTEKKTIWSHVCYT